MIDLKSENVFVIGADALLGESIIDYCQNNDIQVEGIPMDAIDQGRESLVEYELKKTKASVVINAYNRGGGIGKIKNYPADIFMQNMHVFPEIIPCCFRVGVKKYVNILPNCIYPENINIPFVEDQVWNGYPEKTVAPYAMAKKISLVQSQAFRQEYGLEAINLIVTAQYGPKEQFTKDAQVIPSMIQKFYDAKKSGSKKISFWGTGLATREFIYSDDAAEAVMIAVEKYHETEPLNICTGIETKIKSLAEIISKEFDYRGEIEWDIEKPEGCMRKCLSTDKMKQHLGFTPKVDIVDGLQKTVSAFLDKKES